ncbi:MAG: RHS repeat-associated core domain-containing protein [Verrucomicrobiales bacterium]|nr:RHS repeat-associated core domain-containing protein [Verrucomicrobiales bacterium]
MTSKTYESGGLSSTLAHDAKGQVLSVVNSSNAGALEQLSYGYSAVGQRLYMQRADGRGDLYGYDNARQLTGAAIDIDSPSTGGIGLPANDMSYAYDLGGNRSQSIDGGVTTNYTANDVNEYSTVGADTPVHDDNGNLTAGDGLSMSWDAHNRLMVVEPSAPVDGDLRAFYQYDGTGRRISKIVDQYDAGTTSWVASEVRSFVYDGWNVIREGVVDTSGGGIVETQIKRYTWGIDLSGSRQGAGGVGGLLMVEEDNDPANAASPIAAYYYTNDANGNVTTITDTAGVAVAQYEYDAYGNVVASVGAYVSENPYRYSTKYSDDESGWLYYGFRFYSVKTGRWISRDPIGERGGVNLYGFVGNDGVNAVDVFRVNRKLGAKPGQENTARSRCNFISHTFIATTDENGNVENTYSWGNTANLEGWAPQKSKRRCYGGSRSY